MRATIHGVLAFVGTVFLTSTSFALEGQALRDYQVLRNSHQEWTVFGDVCEQVAKLRLQQRFPSQNYIIETGIEYESNGRVAGELDVVVFRRDTSEAVLIAEVKCWIDFAAAQRKAEDQLARFRTTLNTNRIDSMHGADDRNARFEDNQFDENPEMITISQEGGRSAGFDMTLGLTLDEFCEMYRLLGGRGPLPEL